MQPPVQPLSSLILYGPRLEAKSRPTLTPEAFPPIRAFHAHSTTPWAAWEAPGSSVKVHQVLCPPTPTNLDEVIIDNGVDDAFFNDFQRMRCASTAIKQDALIEQPSLLHTRLQSVQTYHSEIATSLNAAHAHFAPDIVHQPTHLHSLRSTLESTRALTYTFDDPYTIMTTAVSAPGSPPDLSTSRSSKSSSTCSSSHDSDPDREGIASDITNFEDIGLDSENTGPRDAVQKSQNNASVSNSSLSGESRRPPFPRIQGQVRMAVRQQENDINIIKSKNQTYLRRGFTTPLMPFVNGPLSPRARSSSPSKRTMTAHAAITLNSDTLKPSWTPTRSSLPLASRRKSWQPHRKSVQELEAECHDSDDELPDDTSLWNVPVSPHPASQRSARSSFSRSPVRSPKGRSSRPIPLAHAQTAPASPPQLRSGSRTLPKQRLPPPRSSSLITSLSNPSSPNARHFKRSDRANSWNFAISELSEEARIVSENLVSHSESAIETSFGAPLHPTTTAPARASQIQLPPVQKGNLDFMPISKEKEAILSRTRPSWLPPKDPKEEKRHLKEYQRMMAASLQADRNKVDKSQIQQCEKDDTQEALSRIWRYYCDESTDLSTLDSRVHSLCWRGVHPRFRGKVWQRRTGNKLGLNQASYEKALKRAGDIQSKGVEQLTERERSMGRWFADIDRDAETAFPELNLFVKHAPMWQDLVDVCKAYACYRSDIGYVYGVQLVAALLLLQLPSPSEAFVLLANCLNQPIPMAFQTSDLAAMGRTYNHAISTLAIKHPRLHEYLFGSIEQGGLGFTGELIFEPMLRTVFCNGLDIDRLCRLWDIWMFEGDRVIVHGAVALLGCLQAQIFEMKGDIDLKRRNIQEMLAWGPFNRGSRGQYWKLDELDEDKFADEIRESGTLDYTGK